MPVDVEITELESFEPTRVDGVGKGANGFPILMLKAIDGDIEETETDLEGALASLDKADGDSTSDADDDRPDCPTCKGKGTIMDGNRKCPKCQGSGKAPKVGDSAKASAPSGAPVPVTNDCPTCKGGGKIADGTDDGKDCPDCEGTGKDGTMPPEGALNRTDGFSGSMNDGNGRTTIDKAEMSGADQNDLPDSAFAYIESGGKKDDDGKIVPRSNRHFPIHDAAHVRNALARASQSPHGDKAMPKIKAAAKKFGIGDDANKGLIEKDGVVSGTNPFLNTMLPAPTASDPTDGTDADDTDGSAAPGTPDWEAADADIATAAATALIEAAELIRQFADREAIEVAAGEGNDVFDTWDAQMALDAVTAAVGVMATLAFHEGVAAQKSEDVAEKAGKRLSTKSVTALAAARDHLTSLLGDDDPAKASDDDDGTKSQRDILDMTPDELTELVATTVAKTVLESNKADKKKAKKAAGADMQDVDHSNSIASAKNANAKGKSNKKKVANTDDSLEDETNQGNNDSASGVNQTSGAAKRVRTPEEIEVRKQRKAAQKALRKAKQLEKKTAKQAEINEAAEKSLKEDTEKGLQVIDALKQRLETVEKMAAPGAPSKTRTPDVAAKASQRDAIQFEIDRYESMAKSTQERELSAGYKAKAKELRDQLASI